MINFVRGWKFIGGFLLIISAALIMWVLTIQFSPEVRQAREARAVLEQIQEEYRNDTFGGETPEETLELFTAALEAGDIELASKYFLPEDREEMLDGLKNVEKNNNLTDMAADLQRKQYKNQISDNNTIISFSNPQGEVDLTVSFFKNPNEVWKISDI